MSRIAGVLIVLAVGMPGGARAQASADGQAPAPPGAPRVIAGPDGVAIESGDGEFRLQFGLLAHLDGRFALADEDGQVVDTFAARRIRPYLRGRLTRRIEFLVNPDFGGGSLVVQDAYVETIIARSFRIRAGKGKAPFGFERLHPVSNILFFERAFPTAIAPNRDVGVQVLGDAAGGVVSYAASVMNGVPDGASADVDLTDGKDVSGRFVVRPFARRAAANALRGLGLAIAASTGHAAGAASLPAFRTQTLQQTYFSYSAATAGDGVRSRLSPQLWFVFRSFGGWVEHVHSTTRIRRGGVAGEIDHDAWQVAASYVLTGETATDTGGGVRPRAPLDFDGGWGALQLAARYHQLTVDEETFVLGLAAPGASRRAGAWTLGLNWYPTVNLRYVVNFERTTFDGDSGRVRPAETAVAFRTQVSF